MKKLVLIFSFLVAFLPSLNAQDPISKEEFEKIIDYVNCELTNFYIGTLTDSIDRENYQKIKASLDQNTLNSPISYSRLTDVLSEGFPKTRDNLTNILDSRKNDYGVNLEIVDILNIALTQGEISTMIFEKILERVNSLHNELENFYGIEETLLSPDPVVPPSQAEGELGTVQQKNTKTYVWNFLFASIIIVGLIGLTVFINFQILKERLQKQRSRTNSSIAARIDNLFFERFGNGNAHPNVDHQRIRDLEEKMKSLNREIIFIKKQQQELTAGVSATSVVNSVSEKFQGTSSVFFFGSPSKESSFLDKQKTKVPTQGITMYKFVPVSDNMAKFSFDGDQISTRDAINTPYKYLEPVCEAENEPFPNASNIRTTEEGAATLIGDYWNIDQKAKIRYE